MIDIWNCPYCESVPLSKYSLQSHIKTDHREYGVDGRCQAYLLTPSSRYWAKHTLKSLRCTFSAKPESVFCGVHAKLGEFIHAIVWRDVE